MNSKPKGNDVIGSVNISLLARRFRELREEEQHKTAQLAAKASKDRSMQDVIDAGIAAGRAQAFGDAAVVLDLVEDDILEQRKAS